MIGGKDAAGVLTAPGIAPRAFDEIYQLLEANKYVILSVSIYHSVSALLLLLLLFIFVFFRDKFSFKVACYMLELYNDRLIDLFSPKGKEISSKLLN